MTSTIRRRVKIPEMTPSNLATMVVLLNKIQKGGEPLTQYQIDSIEKQFDERIPPTWLENVVDGPVSVGSYTFSKQNGKAAFDWNEKLFNLHNIGHAFADGEANERLRRAIARIIKLDPGLWKTAQQLASDAVKGEDE